MDKSMDSDWRLQGQEKYLSGAILRRSEYHPPRENWDHDHCEFCSAKFQRGVGTAALSEGYCTVDEYRWICDKCYEDFKVRFKWKLQGSEPDRGL